MAGTNGYISGRTNQMMLADNYFWRKFSPMQPSVRPFAGRAPGSLIPMFAQLQRTSVMII